MIYFSCLQHMQFVCFWQLIDICSVLRNQVWGIKKWLTQSFLKGGVLATFFSRVATSSATSSGSLSLSGNKCRSVPKPHCSPQTSCPATLSISCSLVLHICQIVHIIFGREILHWAKKIVTWECLNDSSLLVVFNLPRTVPAFSLFLIFLN